MQTVAAVDTERVWADLHASIHDFVNRRVRDHADTEDIVQRVFLNVHRALPDLRDADRIHAWIYQVTRRAIADHFRAPAHRREVTAGDALDLAPAASAAGPDDANEASAFRELARCLQPLVSTLSAADQEALRLVEVDGVSQAEAARRLGLSLSGMKSRVQRARARLRAVVEDCCRVEFDRRGDVIGYAPRHPDPCGCGRPCRDNRGRLTAG
jgi:RNA polymerase sigma-70 factor (ECF subfamily)